ncbi:MAG: hypothetical protein GWP04_11995 [Gammaproteobacteria bacterium]|nr:hypothetical protein [Gammaproteobacteria bacterium]
MFKEFTREPANDPGQVEAALRSEIPDVKVSVMLPPTVPDGATGSSDRLTICETFPIEIASVDVSISWQHDQHDRRLFPRSMASASPAGEDRISGKLESGVEWKMGEIRALPGCVATNRVGLTFIKWDEGADRYHVKNPNDAIS